MIGNEIIIDDGCETWSIKTQKGEEYAKLTFNPSDPDIVNRFEKIVKDINDKNFNGDSAEQIKEINEFLVEKMSELLNRDTSEELFGRQCPTAILGDGDMFIDKLFDIIPKIIEERTDARIEKKMKKIKQATAKYHK